MPLWHALVHVIQVASAVQAGYAIQIAHAMPVMLDQQAHVAQPDQIMWFTM